MPRVSEILVAQAEEGVLSWESIGRAALNYMSEKDIADMASCEELLQEEESEDHS